MLCTCAHHNHDHQMMKKRKQNDEHRRQLELARKEHAPRIHQARMRTHRDFHPGALDDPEPIPPIPDTPTADALEDITETTPKEADQFDSKAFAPRTLREEPQNPNEFLKQFTFNEPLIITASRFDRVNWDGHEDVMGPKSAYGSPAAAAAAAPSAANNVAKSAPSPVLSSTSAKERAINATGTYDWANDPNAFPDAKPADTHDKGTDKMFTQVKEEEAPAAASEENDGGTQLFNTIGSDEYSDDFDTDDDSRKEEALQNIRDAGKAMSEFVTPFNTTVTTAPSPKKAFMGGRLHADLHAMRHHALQALGRAEFNRLHSAVKERWDAAKPLDREFLLELAGGDSKVADHCDELVKLVHVESFLPEKMAY